MSRSIDFISKSVPGYGPHNGRCLSYSGVSGKTVGILFNSSRGDYKLNFDVKCLSLRCASRHTHSVCKASSSSYRRNSDFSRQKKQGFSRNRNRNNEYRDGYEDLEESETFSSKNGPLLSVSGNHKFQATANPGPREKEIVELFRKVQAQLRERAAMKEEKKVEDSQGKSKESETVDSLLKLLRKHSVQQGKKNASNASSKEFILNEPKQVGSSTEERSINISDSNSSVKHETRESPGRHLSRPKSSFQRRSPVPEIKFPPVYADDLVNPVSQDNLDGIGKEIILEPEAEHVHELEIETDSESYVEPLFSEGNVFDEMEDETSELYEGEHDDNVAGENSVEANNLSGMKLTELKALAKSRGMKGFSKLKKNELILLLSESSI